MKSMAVNDQMEMAFSEPVGQDPVSGNDIPIGSLPEEVRDDVPAMLSEGEYVVPADVLRFYGLKFFEDLRSEAKMSLAQMEAGGRIGGEPLEAGSPAVSSSELPNEGADSQMLQASVGGAVGFKDGGVQRAMDAGYPKSPIENANTGLDKYMETVTTPPNPKPMYRGGMAGYAAGGSVEDLFSDMENYADGGAVLSGYDAGGAIPYLNLQSYYPTQNNFDPMNYGLGFSSNLIRPAAPYKTATSIRQESGVDDEGETEAERIARRMANAEDPNNPDGVMGKTYDQMTPQEVFAFGSLLDKFPGDLRSNWPGQVEAEKKALEDTKVFAGNEKGKRGLDPSLDIDTTDNYSAPDTTGGEYSSQQAAENAAAAGIDSGTGSTGISQGSGISYGGGPMNKGGFISRRKKT
jgi:hypothetical protein